MDNKRTDLVAPCGIDCGICELYTCRSDENLKKNLLEKGFPENKIPCNGCRPIEGFCPVIKGECKTYECVKNKKVNYCYQCSDYPCNNLHPCSNRADVLPHNMKMYNLCTIKRDGVEAFVSKSLDIKKRYYMGKMDIGNGPQI